METVNRTKGSEFLGSTKIHPETLGAHGGRNAEKALAAQGLSWHARRDSNPNLLIRSHTVFVPADTTECRFVMSRAAFYQSLCRHVARCTNQYHGVGLQFGCRNRGDIAEHMCRSVRVVRPD